MMLYHYQDLATARYSVTTPITIEAKTTNKQSRHKMFIGD